MKIAILADVHDHRDNLDWFLENVLKREVDHIIHLWDYWAPGRSVTPIIDLWIPIDGIWWNNDGEKRWVMRQFARSELCTMHRTLFGTVELWWKKVFMSHFPDLATPMAKSGEYDIVLYGHTHHRDLQVIGSTIVCNPWGLCGNFESASYALYDTESNTFTFIEME